MTLLPPDFQFSQRSLQDYMDCPRRFQLRYLDQLSWPAVEAEPLIEHENRLRSGAEFHRLVQRYLLGVPEERLSTMLDASDSQSGDLKRWWENFLLYAHLAPVESSLVERTLSARIGNYRLLAKYDLIRWDSDHSNDQVKIYDWKTSQRMPPRQWLADRLQTRVYPYLLVHAGGSIINDGQLSPGQIEMIYWFAEYPQEPQRFSYGLEQYEQDQEYLTGVIGEIDSLYKGDFALTLDEDHCKFCTYRSLCDRGVSAGSIDLAESGKEAEAEDDFDLDFDQIAEIEF